jgi:hypothetical protein
MSDRFGRTAVLRKQGNEDLAPVRQAFARGGHGAPPDPGGGAPIRFGAWHRSRGRLRARLFQHSIESDLRDAQELPDLDCRNLPALRPLVCVVPAYIEHPRNFIDPVGSALAIFGHLDLL